MRLLTASVLMICGAQIGEAQNAIVATPNSVSLITVSGSDPGTQSVSLAGVAGGTVVSIHGYTTSGGAWMTLKVGTINIAGAENFNFTFPFGPGSNTLIIGANPRGLALGNYVGFLVLSAGGPPVTISVVYNVFPNGTIVLSKGTVSLVYPTAVSPAQVQVTNVNTTKPQPNVDVGVRVDYKSGDGWLNVTQSNSQTPSTITIAANPAGLVVNKYQAYVTVNAGGVGNDVVAVTLDVQSQPVTLSVSPAGPLNFTYQLGGAAPQAQPLSINGLGSNFGYTIGSSSPWLKVNPATGTTPATVNVSVDPTTLTAAGTLQGSLSIAGPAGTLNSPANVGVSLQVQPAVSRPQLTLNPAGPLAFAYTAGGPLPDAQNVALGSTGGILSYTATPDQPWLSASPGSGTAPGSLRISVNPGTNPVNTYTGNVTIASNDAINTPVKMAVQMTIASAPPAITEAIQNGASFTPSIAPQSWVTIKGTNLAPTTRTWRSDELINGNLPVALDGVSVTIDGRAAYVYYISPTQINVLSPADPAVGPVPVQVKNGATSATVTGNLQTYAPGLFRLLPSTRIVAFHLNGDIVGPTSLGANFRPAVSGEVLTMFGTGFGPTTPALPQGTVPVPNLLYRTNPVVIRVNGLAADADAVLVNYAGVYQINVRIPDGLPNGDLPIVAEIGGARSPDGFTITVQN